MLDQQPKTNHQVRQHPLPAAGQAPSRQLRAPGKPGEGDPLPGDARVPRFVVVRMHGGVAVGVGAASGRFRALSG